MIKYYLSLGSNINAEANLILAIEKLQQIMGATEYSSIHQTKAEEIIPIDTNGAGDMFAGSFMHAYLERHDIQTCAKCSNYASSRVVETFGPRLDAKGYSGVLNKLKKS